MFWCYMYGVAENCIPYLSPGTTNCDNLYLIGTGFGSFRQRPKQREDIANGEITPSAS